MAAYLVENMNWTHKKIEKDENRNYSLWAQMLPKIEITRGEPKLEIIRYEPQ